MKQAAVIVVYLPCLLRAIINLNFSTLYPYPSFVLMVLFIYIFNFNWEGRVWCHQLYHIAATLLFFFSDDINQPAKIKACLSLGERNWRVGIPFTRKLICYSCSHFIPREWLNGSYCNILNRTCLLRVLLTSTKMHRAKLPSDRFGLLNLSPRTGLLLTYRLPAIWPAKGPCRGSHIILFCFITPFREQNSYW